MPVIQQIWAEFVAYRQCTTLKYAKNSKLVSTFKGKIIGFQSECQILNARKSRAYSNFTIINLVENVCVKDRGTDFIFRAFFNVSCDLFCKK